ncbi:hypothetical protein K7X08_016011 [Anisodus acutangulus]|uniref:Uncharacterized protein n=1 Tax=Anisodus acutangulus TaxID=402998 RepID=A0A9Q1QZ90_9SOLA|nr:hypothetical protein K7X08_016011 [Anisodus acutangulus]
MFHKFKKEKTGVFPSHDDMFLKTHTRKKKNETNEPEWVEPRTKDTWLDIEMWSMGTNKLSLKASHPASTGIGDKNVV